MFGGLKNIHRLQELVWSLYVRKNSQATSLDSSSGVLPIFLLPVLLNIASYCIKVMLYVMIWLAVFDNIFLVHFANLNSSMILYKTCFLTLICSESKSLLFGQALDKH